MNAAGSGAYGPYLGPWTSVHLRGDSDVIKVRNLSIRSIQPGGSRVALYDFESSAQNWTANGLITSVAQSTSRAYRNTHSLAVQFANGAGQPQTYVLAPSLPQGVTSVEFRVWIPSSSPLTAVSPFVQEGDPNWRWFDAWQGISSLTNGAWNTFTVNLPSDLQLPVYRLGVEFTTGSSGTWSAPCYIDAIDAVSA